MKLTDKNIFNGLDVDGIIKQSIRNQLKKDTESLPSDSLNESYVAEPKQFKQVSEFVSQKTKDAHVEKYKNYLESLNKVSSALDTANRSDVNHRHSEYRSLKLDEVFNLNALWLHELYFSNCFDPHSEIVMDSMAYIRLQRDFGTFDDWQRDFMACALASKNGWAVCGYHTFLRKYVNFFVDDHTGNVPVGFYPLIVVDMWEHSYYRDYLNDAKSYLVAQMREFNWGVIEDRFKKAEGIHQVVK
jgi:Fe-Mn family superoxide dismutase